MIWIDFETFSTVPIKHGTYRYLESAEALLCAYAFDDQPVQVWDITASPKMPGDLEFGILDTDEPITAHNAMFDRNVFNLAKNVRRQIPLERWRCTMVRALAHSLPGSLDLLCEILDVPVDQRKQKVGKSLMRLFCIPRPKTSKILRATRHSHPVEWAQFVEYAKHDVEAMRVVAGKLPDWNYKGAELDLWHLDQRINDRGICVDVELAKAAIGAVAREQKRLGEVTQEMTGGAVASATQRDQLIAYILQEYGVDLPNMQASTLERRVQDPDLPIELRDLLGVRMQSTTTSTAKYNALVRGVSPDGRLRGTKQFNGAGRTGRWAGRVFQPDNLPRPGHKQHEIEEFIGAAKLDVSDMICPDVMGVASSAIRGCIVAPDGKKLIVSDLSNIEGRKASWLAGEDWKLAAFRDYDTIIGIEAGVPLRKGHDLYKLAYAEAFRIHPAEVNKDQRQIGKVMELMLQYEGGVGAFVTGAATYRIDLEAMAENAWAELPGDVVFAAEEFMDWCEDQGRPTFGLSRRAFVTCETFKRLWRRAHPEITSYWPELRATVAEAIAGPGRTLGCRRLKIRCDGAWLRIGLPSGRALCYPSPRVTDRGEISYMGINQYTRQWSRIKTYGGKLLENITQAASRDVLASAMAPAECAGYGIVLTVHDEIIAEAPDTDDYSAEGLGALMSTPPGWATGLPLAAGGFETYRYRKE